MRYSLLVLALCAGSLCNAQSLGVSVNSSTGEGEVGDLYHFLKVDRYAAIFTGDTARKFNVVLVMRSLGKDGIEKVDTLMNTVNYNKLVVGHEAFKWTPSSGASFMAQTVDSLHVKIACQIGKQSDVRIYTLEPGQEYSMNEGVDSFENPAEVTMGKPIPIVVYTQPYPDPPPPKKVVVYRFCFSTDVPPDQWPKIFGVPHLLILEMTVLP